MAKFKYRYNDATERYITVENHRRDKYANRPDIVSYIDLGLPINAPDGFYLHRKSKYNHIVYLNIGGLCTVTNPYHANNDKFKPQPISIFMLDKDMRNSLVKCYNYLTDQMQYEVRCYLDREKERQLRKVLIRLKNKTA
jgi:hypothetical protein